MGFNSGSSDGGAGDAARMQMLQLQMESEQQNNLFKSQLAQQQQQDRAAQDQQKLQDQQRQQQLADARAQEQATAAADQKKQNDSATTSRNNQDYLDALNRSNATASAFANGLPGFSSLVNANDTNKQSNRIVKDPAYGYPNGQPSPVGASGFNLSQLGGRRYTQ